jgi:GNAT superfamily N-acetyltransferase
MREFAEFEKLLDRLEVTYDRLTAALFGDQKVADALVADINGEIVAYAIFFPYFATFRGQRGLYLEDIFISEARRGKGIGEALIREIARIARSRGFERIDLQVIEWNAPAIAFYEKLGAVRDNEERHFKFTDGAFRNLAS